jgi:hypothetical protein
MVRQIIPVLFLAAATHAQTGSADRVMAVEPSNPGFLDRLLNVRPLDEQPVLTPHERLKEYLLNTIGPTPLLGSALGGAIGQGTDSPGEWGQGWAAYGKRVANNFGYNAVRQTIVYGVGTAFHEDTRYSLSGQSQFGSRVKYALTSTFMARGPDGRRHVSIASVAGVLGAVAIQTLWMPPSGRTPERVAANIGISFGATAGLNAVREFLPDLLHRRD